MFGRLEILNLAFSCFTRVNKAVHLHVAGVCVFVCVCVVSSSSLARCAPDERPVPSRDCMQSPVQLTKAPSLSNCANKAAAATGSEAGLTR